MGSLSTMTEWKVSRFELNSKADYSIERSIHSIDLPARSRGIRRM